MPRPNLKFDFKQLSNLGSQLPKSASSMLGRFSDQLNGYEKRVRGIVKEIDVKSRDAREKSAQRLDRFAQHVKKTRNNVEKRVVSLVNTEGKRLNKRVNELVDYLRGISVAETKTASKVKKATSARKPSRKAGTRKKKASKTIQSARLTPTEGVGESLPSA